MIIWYNSYLYYYYYSYIFIILFLFFHIKNGCNYDTIQVSNVYFEVVDKYNKYVRYYLNKNNYNK